MLFVARALIIGLGSRVVVDGTARIVLGNARYLFVVEIRDAFALLLPFTRKRGDASGARRRARGERECESENERCLFVETDRHGSLVVNYYGNWRCKTRDRAPRCRSDGSRVIARSRESRRKKI